MNPLIGTDLRETAQSVRNVLELMAAYQPTGGEETAEMADGRRLVLEACSEALATIAERSHARRAGSKVTALG